MEFQIFLPTKVFFGKEYLSKIKEIKNFMANKTSDTSEKIVEKPEPIKGTEKPTRKNWTEKKPRSPISVEA